MDRGDDDPSTRVDTLMDGRVAGPERLTATPSTVVGIDAPSVDHAASAVVPYARAGPNPRFHPEQDPREAQGLLVTRPESPRPFGIPLTGTRGDTGPGCQPATDGPRCRAARAEYAKTYGAAAGGSAA